MTYDPAEDRRRHNEWVDELASDIEWEPLRDFILRLKEPVMEDIDEGGDGFVFGLSGDPCDMCGELVPVMYLGEGVVCCRACLGWSSVEASDVSVNGQDEA